MCHGPGLCGQDLPGRRYRRQTCHAHHRTLVSGIDPAHSLGDSFTLEIDLSHLQTSDPLPVSDRLCIEELNIQEEIKRHWQEIFSYQANLKIDRLSVLILSELSITQDRIMLFAVATALIERIKWTQEGRGFETQE